MTGYSDLDKRFEELRNSEGAKVVILLNCGARIDLTEQWFVQSGEVLTLMLDSHRPVHHANVNYNEKYTFADDLV